MHQDTIHSEEHSSFRTTLARAGAWSLLVVGLLVVCASLPMIALSH